MAKTKAETFSINANDSMEELKEWLKQANPADYTNGNDSMEELKEWLKPSATCETVALMIAWKSLKSG